MPGPWPYRPGVPAAGHVTSGGHWHPGAIQGCRKCNPPQPHPRQEHRMTTTNTPRLGWGAVRSIPEGVTAAWGARLIWPDDLVHNRQDMIGTDAERKALAGWLNGGPIKAAFTEARRLRDSYELRPEEDRTVTLYEDETGIVVGNPQASFGYLYVAAWMKGER